MNKLKSNIVIHLLKTQTLVSSLSSEVLTSCLHKKLITNLHIFRTISLPFFNHFGIHFRFRKQYVQVSNKQAEAIFLCVFITSQQIIYYIKIASKVENCSEIVKQACSYNRYPVLVGNLYFYCRGEKTMMNFYKMAEKSCEECQQLAPAMDIDLFTGYFL